MAQMERNGICVDVPYIEWTQRKIQRRIDHLTKTLESDKVFRRWKKVFGSRTKLGSRDQLAHVLFVEMKIPTEGRTKTRYSADVDALEDVKLPFVRRYLECEKLKNAKNTFLANILRETCDGRIHPNNNLNIPRTYRSSCDRPNFHNMPKHDELIHRLVRRALVASPDHCLVDLDFKGSEVCAAAWYHKDPNMLDYLADTTKDMHRDMGQQIYMVPRKLMTEPIRQAAKNKFVFPEFYADWWMQCAGYLWKAIDRMDLKTSNGVPLKKWLARKGILSLGTHDSKSVDPGSFEAHIQEVEHDFWYNRFAVYQQWKENWWEEYQKNGSFRMLSGFLVDGYINRKECINWPIQGTAFHCLLWCIIRIQHLLKKYRMRSRLIGQIHDSLISDTHKDELKDYTDLAVDVITRQLPKHWRWIITSMRVDVKVSPVGGNWYEEA
jgi:DNA polymerase I-like protein with 3'-5' exonuclease and polymerase domains